VNDVKAELLRAAIEHLTRLAANTKLKSANDERLRKALRELREFQKGGKLNLRRIERFVALVAEVLCDEMSSKGSDKAEGRW
jgi:hypothetical protein